MTTVAFIGLGNMGSGMADNLVKNDYNVLAFDLSEAALVKAKEAGLIMVSHEMDQVREFCTSAIIIEDGQLNYYGDLEEGIAAYME